MSLPEMLQDLFIEKQPPRLPVERRCLLQSLQVFRNVQGALLAPAKNVPLLQKWGFSSTVVDLLQGRAVPWALDIAEDSGAVTPKISWQTFLEYP